VRENYEKNGETPIKHPQKKVFLTQENAKIKRTPMGKFPGQFLYLVES
jgi:hypothetical protein